MFENPEILLADLPSVDTVDWQSLDPRFVRRLLLQTVLTVLAGIILLTVAHLVIVKIGIEPGLSSIFGWLWLLLLPGAVPFLVWPLISVPRQGYAIRDRDIVFKSGVIWQKVTAIPYNRIQHVEKVSTPLDRRYDISNLKIFTAGGSAGDLKINGLTDSVAESLRIMILDKVGVLVEQE